MLVLVIILMVTAEFTRYHSVAVSLPKINASAVKKEPQRMILTIKKDKSIWINDKALIQDQNLLAVLVATKTEKPDIALILRAEENIDYNYVVQILDQAKSAGISKIGLAVEPIQSGKKK